MSTLYGSFKEKENYRQPTKKCLQTRKKVLQYLIKVVIVTYCCTFPEPKSTKIFMDI